MTSFSKLLIALLVAGCGALVAGCSTNSPKNTSIPWGQPAAWEGQIPGMAQPTGR